MKFLGYFAVCLIVWVLILPAEKDLQPAVQIDTPKAPQPIRLQPAALAVEDSKTQDFAALPKPAALAPPSPTLLPNPPKIQIAPNYVFVTGSRVNLRQGPSTQDPIVGGFNQRTKLVLLEDFGDWSKVTGNEAGVPKTGWMASRYLTRTTPKAPAPKVKPAKRQIAVPTTREVALARQTLIRQSIANYSGNCPCPYNRDRANRRCGKRSAWSRPGGRAPLCYDSDVNRSRLTAYFSRKGQIWP